MITTLPAAVAAATEHSKRTRSAEDQAAVDVTVRRAEAPTEEAVAEEAKKGYDLLFAGIKNPRRTRSGDFHPEITRVSAVFEGPLAIVDAAGRHFERIEMHDNDKACARIWRQGVEKALQGADAASRSADCDNRWGVAVCRWQPILFIRHEPLPYNHVNPDQSCRGSLQRCECAKPSVITRW